MKKLVIATILILGLTTYPIHAQDSDIPSTETETATQDDSTTNSDTDVMTDEQMQEETEKQISEGTLSEQLNVEETQKLSFGTILLAVLTPALLIAVAYMMIKMANK
jgi:hypothetical protein